jgi:hypothetical protein
LRASRKSNNNVPPKRLLNFIRLLGVIYHNTVLILTIAAITSNPENRSTGRTRGLKLHRQFALQTTVNNVEMHPVTQADGYDPCSSASLHISSILALKPFFGNSELVTRNLQFQNLAQGVYGIFERDVHFLFSQYSAY